MPDQNHELGPVQSRGNPVVPGLELGWQQEGGCQDRLPRDFLSHGPSLGN